MNLVRSKREKLNYLNSPQHRINYRIKGLVNYMIRTQRDSRTIKCIFGYGWKELKQRLESQFVLGMSWANYGDWHIDHIIPKSHFFFTDEKSYYCSMCWSLKNLQPLWAEENIKKGSWG